MWLLRKTYASYTERSKRQQFKDRPTIDLNKDAVLLFALFEAEKCSLWSKSITVPPNVALTSHSYLDALTSSFLKHASDGPHLIIPDSRPCLCQNICYVWVYIHWVQCDKLPATECLVSSPWLNALSKARYINSSWGYVDHDKREVSASFSCSRNVMNKKLFLIGYGSLNVVVIWDYVVYQLQSSRCSTSWLMRGCRRNLRRRSKSVRP